MELWKEINLQSNSVITSWKGYFVSLQLMSVMLRWTVRN